ncbi:class I SAM-dependent methyltransferase [Paenibacillus thiaminolyticus]|uniref:class I SAM-dependent methyltransferase n=1 Tax=Paenibacillus thiaminolyticus TaxID=49283 RepID=UPI00232DA56A|nr:class I SAM-dependent methyltransferase [Paenibacillus thiaminolyticus]WCF07925.1 class I SAM-dependent methyltransferase [Paenibacillus thiaminolyticus]
MKYIDIHQKKWDNLHRRSQFQLKFPNEMIIRFIKGNFKKGHPGQTKILDLGCGTGRHVIFLAQEGYDVTGIDFSRPGLDFTKHALAELGLQANLIEGSITQLPFPDNYFDGIVSFAVIYYFLSEDIDCIIQEIYRTLKPGGKAFIVVRSTADRRYGKGENAGEHTFKMNTNFTNEEGMTIHFFTVEEIRRRCAVFSELSIGLLESGMDSQDEYDSDFLITVTK